MQRSQSMKGYLKPVGCRELVVTDGIKWRREFFPTLEARKRSQVSTVLRRARPCCRGPSPILQDVEMLWRRTLLPPTEASSGETSCPAVYYWRGYFADFSNSKETVSFLSGLESPITLRLTFDVWCPELVITWTFCNIFKVSWPTNICLMLF